MDSKADSKEAPMSAPEPSTPKILPRPAETPSAIRAVLAANADPGVVERFDKSLDVAWSEAKAAHSIAPLEKMLHRWWWEAVQWSDPETHRALLARVEKLRRDGLPPESERLTREQIRERYGI
jgi:hypothetical protein